MPVPTPAPPTEPLLFAHRGGRAHAPENTLEAFRTAVSLGATGLESDVWLSADGVPVLLHSGAVGGLLRRRAVGRVPASELPDHIPTLASLYGSVGPGVHISLDLKDDRAAPRVLEVAGRVPGAMERLWLCHPDLELLLPLREVDTRVRLVLSTSVGRAEQGLERLAAELATGGLDAVNLPVVEWSEGLVALFHRFGVLCMGWDANLPRQVRALLHAGLDGIFGDDVATMVAEAEAFLGR